jgi:hypothetical protein
MLEILLMMDDVDYVDKMDVHIVHVVHFVHVAVQVPYTGVHHEAYFGSSPRTAFMKMP